MHKSVFFKSNTASFDEELLDLKDELSKQHQLYEDNLSLLQKIPDKPNIEKQLLSDKRNYYNNTPKNQETLRVKFIGNMLKNLTYYNNFETFLDDFYERKEKLLFANKDPNEIRQFLQKKLTKKVEIDEIIVQKLGFLLNYKGNTNTNNKLEDSELNKSNEIILDLSNLKKKTSDYNKEAVFKGILDTLAQEKALISKMEAVNFLEKRNEDELITEKHLYENFKQQMQDNFGFIDEKTLENLVNDLASQVKMKKKLAILKIFLSKLPYEVFFDYYNNENPNDFFSKAKINDYFPEKPVLVPLKLDEITKKLVNLAKELGLNEDVSKDNGAFLLFTIDNFFIKTFKEQAKFLDFSLFKYREKGSETEDLYYKIEKFEVFIDQSLEFLFKPPDDKRLLVQNKRLLMFEDSLVNSWVNCLMINDENETFFFIEKKSREYYEQHKKELYLPEIYFEFFKGFLKLLLINSRKSLINIFSYCNFLKHFERNMRILAKNQAFPNEKPHFSNFSNDFSNFSDDFSNESPVEFDDNDFLSIFDSKSPKKQLIYDLTIKDFSEEITYIKHLASFSVHFNQKPIKLNPISSEIEPITFDNINRQELIDEILQFHCRFLREKTKILLKLSEIKGLATNSLRFNEFLGFSMGILRKRPDFPLFKDEIFKTYACEINNLELLADFIRNILDFQTKLERKMWKNRGNQGLFQLLLKEQEKPYKILLFANEIIKTFNRISEGLELIEALFKENPCELMKSRIKGVFLKKSNDFWLNYIDKSPNSIANNEFLFEIHEIIKDFMENDEILDNFLVFQSFLDFIQKGSFENKTDSPKLKKSLQANSLNMKDKLILSLNLLEFLRIREKIRKSLYSLAFSLKVFKKQQLVFIRDPVKIENIIGVNNTGNLLKGLINLDGLKCNIDIMNLKTWIVFLINQKKMDEPFLFLQYIFSIESLLSQYVIANNFYYRRIKEEFGSETEVVRKLAESSENFLDIFEKKKTMAFKVLQFKRVSIFTGVNISQEKDSKIMNKNVNYNPFFNKGYKSQTAQTINDFTVLMNKETYYEILKLNSILLRNSLENLNKKLPSRLKLLKIAGLKKPTISQLKPTSLLPAKIANKLIADIKYKEKEKDKYLPCLFPSNLLNLDILPSIEDISRLKIEDLPIPINNPIITNGLFEQKSREFIKISEARGEIKPSSSSNLNISGVNKRRSSILLTPASQIQVFQKNNRKKPLKCKEFEYLKESPAYLQMNILYHLLNILAFELFRRLAENSLQDLLIYLEGLMDEGEYKRKSRENQSFDDLKRNIVRISAKLHFIREDLDDIERNIAIIHEKYIEKSTNTMNFPKEIMKYLKTIHKKQYNMFLMSLFVDFKEKNSRFLLEKFCFNKLSFIFEKNRLFPMKNQEESQKMSILDEVFLKERIKPNFSNDLLIFFFRNNLKNIDLFDFLLMNLEQDFKRKTIGNYNEISRILFIRKDENIDNFSNEILKKKSLQINIKAIIFKLIAGIANNNQDNEEITRKIGFLEKILEKEQKLRVLIDPAKNKPLELSRFLQENDFISKKLDFLSNEIEKGFISEGIGFYLLRNQLYSRFINERNYILNLSMANFNENIEEKTIERGVSMIKYQKIEDIEIKPIKENRPINQLLMAFSSKFLAFSSQINIFKMGKGFVIPIKRLKDDISFLNASFLGYLSQAFAYFLLTSYNSSKLLLFSSEPQEISLENLSMKRNFLNKSFNEIVESKIAKKSSDLLFSLDHLYKALNYMKDEEALREQEIKKITRNEFSERIVDKKNDINIINSRFEDYKTGMTYDLTKYIEEAKTEAEKMIQKRNNYRPSFLTRFTKIFKTNEGNAENDEKITEETAKYKDKSKLFKTFRQLRVFFVLRHQVLKQKFFKDLEQKNQKFISSEVLWNKIKDLEKSEARIKEALINSEKEIAVLEHQNLVLKKEVRNITLEKVQLYKGNNLQRGQILELEENFAVLKRKKFIDNPDTESMMKANIRPMSTVANKLLKQQTQFFALNNEEEIEISATLNKENTKKETINEKKNRAFSAKKIGISEFSNNSFWPDCLNKKKKVYMSEKKKGWGTESGLFVRKSFKITTGSMSNLKFYAKEEEEKGGEKKTLNENNKKNKKKRL